MVFDLKQYGDDIALVDGDAACTYAELADLSERIAAEAGGRQLAFIVCTNTVPSIAGYVGFLNAGIVPLLVDNSLDDELLRNLVESYRPSVIWMPAGRFSSFSRLEPAFEQAGYVLAKASEGQPTALFGDLAVLITTSGSTGTAKLVRLSYRNIVSNTRQIIEYLGITSDERAITSLPMSYVYGLSVLQTHLYAGASLALIELPCYGAEFWKVFDRLACTSFAGVPFMYEMLDKLRFTRKEPPATLRTMTQAGGHLSAELQDKFTRWSSEYGVKFFVMYGASEATARMGYLPPERALEKNGSAGVVIPGGRYEIVDEHGAPLPAGEEGELAYEGPNVSLGYATCREDLAKGDDNHGRLLTGDMARMDDEGFVYITGRKKRFIKILGKRTNLAEVEELVKNRFHIVDAVCAGHDDLLRLFLTDASLAEDAAAFVHEKTGINAKMIQVTVVDSIPKSSSGKVLYAQLEELA